MAAAIYFLCTLTALVCALLLLRAFQRSRFRLLFWSGLCFCALTLENLFLFLDRIVWPQVDMTIWYRPVSLVALAGVALLLFGMIWEERTK